VPVLTTTLKTRIGASVGLPASGVTIPAVNAQWLQGTATGLGDQTLRLKARFLDRRRVGLAAATEFRLPTGDEFDYHGAGAFGWKTFLIASFPSKRVSPHVNAGYQWNGSSFLASSTLTEKRRLPTQVFYAAGADYVLNTRLTAAFDLLDNIVINGQRAFIQPVTIDGIVYNSTNFPYETRHEVGASAGFKARLLHRGEVTPLSRDLVLTANALFRLNQAGLRARVIPLVTLSYTFGGVAP
jgi:hypothetical protein